MRAWWAGWRFRWKVNRTAARFRRMPPAEVEAEMAATDEFLVWQLRRALGLSQR